MLSIMGHMSRAMLERYRHIRMAAKRTAVESVGTKPDAKKEAIGVPQESPKSPNHHRSIVRILLNLMVSAVGIEPTT
jgi:hypothetical protein